MRNKIGMRVVSNCHMTFEDVFMKEEHKLAKVKNFQVGANTVLKYSRPIVCWIALGICLGVYDNVIQYVRERKQFGRPVAGILCVM